ncbi:MAG: helix-turn-helix domain-containing protein [Actinomycetales bacterium]|nr:helix-turn-helix domain-containing protein [Actinomycetales bacterium]
MSTDTTSVSGPVLEPLLSIEEVAGYLGVAVTTIYDWRVGGGGPRAIRVGRHLRFARADVAAWVEAHRESRPGDPPVALFAVER